MPRPLPLLTSLAALWLAAPAHGEDLTPDRLATIQHDEQKAMDKVSKEHGNRTPFEMSPEERREVMEKQAAAKQQVLRKHGVELKDYVVRSSKLSREDRAEVESRRKALKEQDEASARQQAQADKKEEAPREVIIRVGLGEEDPVDVSDTDDYDAVPTEELEGSSTGEGAPAVEEAPAEPVKPARKKSGKRSR